MDSNNEITLINKAVNTTITPSIVEITNGIVDNEDKEVTIFFLEWTKNGFNATKAYKILHPEVTDESARVLGSRKLTKVNISAILAIYGFDYIDFFNHLKEGLNATKWNDSANQDMPDYRTRLEFLKIEGKLLGILKE